MSRSTICALAVGVLLGAAATGFLPAVHAADPETTIRTEGNVIVFLVEGQERARIDAQGLLVNGALTYSGALTRAGDDGTSAIPGPETMERDR